MTVLGWHRRLGVRLAGAFGLAAVLVMVAAAPASADAEVVSTAPSGDSVLKVSPKEIALSFSESVEVSLGSIELFDQKGDRVDIGAPHHSAGSDARIAANTPHLDNGAYVVTWRVISADSHPVHGAFTFAVGRASGSTASLAAQLEAKANGDRAVGVLFALARATEYAGIALLIGGAVFAAAIRPHGRRRSRADAIVWVGWIGLMVATVAALFLQGPYAGGQSLSAIFHVSVVRAVLDTRYGHIAELRLLLLLAALPLLLAVRKSWRPEPWWWVVATPIGLAIAATPGLVGHVATGTFINLAIPADTLHVCAMSIWLGGLTSLALIGLDRDPDARVAADHFSPVALWSVVVIVVTGIFVTWREVGWSFDAFRHTSYGNILFSKIAVFVVLIALAVWSRHVVRARRPASLSAAVATERTGTRESQSGPADPEVRSLRLSVFGELLFGITVLVITSMLVNVQPARSALSLPFSTQVSTPTTLINVTVDPAKAGPIVMHIYALTPSGAVQYIQDMTASFRLPSKGIASIDVPLERAGPNHFQNTGFKVPFAGKWKLTVRVYKTQINEVAVQTDIPIR